LADGCKTLTGFTGARSGNQRIEEIFPKPSMFPEVNNRRHFPAPLIYYESNPTHANKLARNARK
jgi:hypothetical protein